MGISESIADGRLKAMNQIHRAVLALSGGRIGGSMGNMPVYKVTTVGRTSGQPRSVMLTSPLEHDDALVFVASKGGDDRDPDWYRNMVANPAFTAEPVDGEGPIELVARTASSEEKAELWPQIVATYKGYAGYASKSKRDIPVVIAERVTA